MLSNSKNNHRNIFSLIILLMAIGAILRFYNLGHFSFWADELKSITDANHLKNVKAFFTPSGNAHPKLYYLILRFWMKLGDGEFFLRVISVLFGLLVIPSAYFLGKEIYNTRVGLLAAFAVAVSPLHLLYDRELRMYSLFTFLSTTSLYFFLQSLRGNKRYSWVMYTLVTTLNLYTHYHSFLLIFAQWVYVLLKLKEYRGLVPRLITANAVSGIFFLPWFVNGMLYHMHNLSPWTRSTDVFPVKSLTYVLKPLYIIYGLTMGQTLLPWKAAGIAGILIVAAVGLIGLVKFSKGREGNKFVMIIFTAVLVPGVLVSHSMPRYYMLIAPLVYIFLVSSIEKVRRARLVLTLLTGILICWSFGIYNYYKGQDYHIMATIDPWREVGDFLSQNVRKEDTVINIGGAMLTNYYYTGPKEAMPSTLGNEAFEEVMKRIKDKNWYNI